MENKNTFWNKLVENNNLTTTENGDKAYKSTLNGLMDLMFKGPLKRQKTEPDECLIDLFKAAYIENPLYAIRLLFYIRDIRGGQGTRNFFRKIFVYIASVNPNLAIELIKYIPEYGSWKDIICILNDRHKFSSVVTDEIIKFIRAQIDSDIKNILNNKSISLLFKWLPSENASSNETKMLAKFIRKCLNLYAENYRKMLSTGRKYINIVERNICSKSYDKIEYSAVPSLAMMKYKCIFESKDNERFSKYITDLSEGKTKVNAATLYPYDIINGMHKVDIFNSNIRKLVDEQWKALPDFFAGKFDNSIVVADVSGSMYGIPMDVCISLAIYIAERNKGAFHNKFITFSESPTLQSIIGTNISEKVHNLSKADWGYNTNLDKVFKLLYSAVTPETVADMPSSIYIISDMQFDDCCEPNKTVYEKWRDKFKNDLGIELPKIIFWNVNNSYSTTPVTMNDDGVLLVSGFSPAILKYIMSGKYTNSLSLIQDIVLSERYKNILNEETVSLLK